MSEANERDEAQGFDLDSVLKTARDNGYSLLTEDAMTKRLAREKRKREEMQEQLDALVSERSEYAAKIEEYENKGKSEDQLRAAEFEKLERQRDAYKAQVDEVNAIAEQRAADLRKHTLESQVSGLLQDKAVNLKHATLIALNEMSGLDIDDSNQLRITDPNTAIEYTGDDAAQRISQWWDGQKHLHRAAPGGPPASDARPGNGTSGSKWHDPNATLEERMGEMDATMLPPQAGGFGNPA